MNQSGDSGTRSLLDIRQVTLVFVSGRMTLDDGSEIDSRQAGDASTMRAVRGALTATAEWWAAVSSVVLPTLDDAPGGYALLVGARTIARAMVDGEIRRSSLKRLLRGIVGEVSVRRSGIGAELPADYERIATLRNGQGDHMGAVGVRTKDDTSRWRFLEGNDFYLRVVAGNLGARVVVDTTGAFLANGYGPLGLGSLSMDLAGRSSSASPDLIVLPDTPQMRAHVDALLAGGQTGVASGEPSAAKFDPTAPRDPTEFLRLAILHATCGVSGLLRAGHWEDGAELEAARMLLLQRFDLKLGLWDLALNPVLRSTVLDSMPVSPPPKQPVQPPANGWRRAKRAAASATARRDASRRAVQEVTTLLHQALASMGWTVNEAGSLCLPLTEPLANWPDAPKAPLVVLRIEVNKSSVRVVAWNWLYNDLDINAFVEKRREVFESVAQLPGWTNSSSSVQLWTASTGWGDADAEWPSIAKAIAERTKPWAGLLADFVAASRRVRRERFARHRE